MNRTIACFLWAWYISGMEDIKDNKCFFEKINLFIDISKNLNNSDIKYEYLKLVKEFHPDRNPDNKMANEYMIVINYVYGQLLNNKQFTLNIIDEYDKNKINDKYCFINEYGIKEFITDKTLYVYKTGVLEYKKAYMIMHNNPSYTGNIEKTGYEIIGHLYKSYKHLKNVIEMDKDGNWGREAKVSLHYAYEMNAHVTRGLSRNDEKDITKI
jgi:hypothetical protein